MTRLSLVTFFVRSLYLLVVFAIRQLPASFNVRIIPNLLCIAANRPNEQVRIDSDLFLSAFSYESDGKRRKLGPWEYAPHVNGSSISRLRIAAGWLPVT